MPPVNGNYDWPSKGWTGYIVDTYNIMSLSIQTLICI